MKTLKRAIVITMAVLVFGLVAKANAADTYLGDFCWTIPDRPDIDNLLKLGVYEKEGGHFTLYGTETFSDEFGFKGIGAVNGNAEVVGNEILVTVTGTDDGIDIIPTTFSSTIQATLDAGTLSGTVHIMGLVQYASEGDVLPFSIHGDMTLITCP